MFNRNQFDDIDFEWATKTKEWLKAKQLPGNFKIIDHTVIKEKRDGVLSKTRVARVGEGKDKKVG